MHVAAEQMPLPDMTWTQPIENKRALLAGYWRGDGSWSYIRGGPSVILECGTTSRELADGLLRLLADLGVVASMRVGRTTKSTRDTYWLRISGADQVENLLDLVPESERKAITNSSTARRSASHRPDTDERERTLHGCGSLPSSVARSRARCTRLKFRACTHLSLLAGWSPTTAFPKM